MHDDSSKALADSPAAIAPSHGRTRGVQVILNAAPEVRSLPTAQSTPIAACTGRSDVPRQLTPTVLEPTPAQWKCFYDEDCTLLASSLRRRIDYVDNPLFHEHDVEKRLFGDTPTKPRESTRVTRLERNANGTLTSSDQALLFQQLNFARRQQLEILWRFRGRRIPMPILRTLLRWARVEMSACNTLTEANLPLVFAMCKKVRLAEVDLSDQISDGSLALLHCVKKFDCSRGFQFSTYACKAILKSLGRAGHRQARHRARFPVEFDPTLEPGDFGDRRHAEAESLYLETIGKILRENGAELSGQESAVIRARFMLGTQAPGSKGPPLRRVGELIGVTKERARQIQNKALQKLRGVLQAS